MKVALIGYGLGGAAFHAPLIAAVRDLDLAVIVTRNPERRAAAARAHPGAVLLDGADDVWARADDLDLVVVASPNRFHVPHALAAIDAGLAVVVDKPFAPTAAQAREVAEAAARRGAPLAVFQNRRWDGDLLTVRRLVAEGALGNVLRFESRFERWRPEVGEGWRERAAPEEAGGLLYDLGTHLVDQALHLFGPAEEVYAELDARRPRAQVDDDVFVALRHASGVRSHLWMSAVAAQLGPRMRVLGDRAAYVKEGLDAQEAALRAGRGPAGDEHWGEEPEARWGRLGTEDAWRPVRTEPGAYQRFYDGVAASVRDGAPPPVDPAEAIAVLEVLDEIRAPGTAM